MTSRRELIQNSAVLAAIAALGIKPENVLAAEGDVLKVRIESDLQVLDPGYMIGGVEQSIQNACLPRLAISVKDANGNWSWALSDYAEKVNQDDPTHISFTLKPGFRWSGDLGEVTAEDVKFSFERMLKSDWAGRWPTLEKVEVKDKYNGVIVLKTPYAATFLLGLASESGTIVPKAAVEKLKDQKFTTELPGQCGPYVLAEWTPEQRIVLRADPNWPGTKPAFAEVQFIPIKEPSAAELAFEAGEVTITSVLPPTAARYARQLPAHAKLLNVAGPFYTWIGMNTEHEKLKDKRVRQAIQRAIDVKSILDAAYEGTAPQAHGIVPPGLTGYRSASKYSYNPEEAKKLLADAGVSDLSLKINTLNEAYRITALQIVQANLADIGIKLEIVPTDPGPFWNLGLESQGDAWKTIELWWMRFRTAPDPSDAVQWFVKSQVGVWNWERWSDPEFEELWTEGLAETDPVKRDAIYQRMQEIMEDTGAYVWITHDPLSYAHKDSIVPEFQAGGEYLVERFKKV
jgi:peptide/nickel transport system substrate-binding protein